MNTIDRFINPCFPPFQAAIIVIVGLLCLRWRSYRSSAGWFALATCWLWLCCSQRFAELLATGLESQYPAVPLSTIPRIPADAIVVLGGGTLPRLEQDWSVDATSNDTRLGLGLALYRDARAPTLLLSGGDHEAEQMALWLQAQGLPTGTVITEEKSLSTHQNAAFSAAILKRERETTVILVTSAIHMPRAIASFRREGLKVLPASSGESLPDANQVTHTWWPRKSAMYLSARCMREYIGLWIYELMGWA